MSNTIIATVKGENVTLARLIWQHLGMQPVGYLEKVLAANRGLADSVFLPIGTEVTLSVEDASEASEAETVIRLWD